MEEEVDLTYATYEWDEERLWQPKEVEELNDLFKGIYQDAIISTLNAPSFLQQHLMNTAYTRGQQWLQVPLVDESAPFEGIWGGVTRSTEPMFRSASNPTPSYYTTYRRQLDDSDNQRGRD